MKNTSVSLTLLVVLSVLGCSGNTIAAKDINKTEENVRVIKYPISSNFYSECRKNKSEKECRKISDIKDYSYQSTKILKELQLKRIFFQIVR
ncbi:hypothetical protein [Acinetobacter sp. 99]|uniref:hypothetical protein n=1 Tax=Acinetobacter sp. 99 TaxID=3098765 RepID=UPI003FA54479